MYMNSMVFFGCSVIIAYFDSHQTWRGICRFCRVGSTAPHKTVFRKPI